MAWVSCRGPTVVGLLVCCLAGCLGPALPSVASDWVCHPIDPTRATLPQRPCFRALQIAENRVQLQWRVTNSRSLVYLYDQSGWMVDDPGFVPARCPRRSEQGCSTEVWLRTGGERRWVLAVTSEEGASIHASVRLAAPSPHPPALVDAPLPVSWLSPESRRFSWRSSADNGWDALPLAQAWVEVSRPGRLHYERQKYPRQGPGAEYTVPAAELDVRGDRLYRIRDCMQSTDAPAPFCSPPTAVNIPVEVDRFQQPSPIRVSPGEAAEIRFTRQHGRVRMLLSEPALGPESHPAYVISAGDRYTIDAGDLEPGTYKLQLVSCDYPPLRCANREDAPRASSAGIVEPVGGGFQYGGSVVAHLKDERGRVLQTLLAPADGLVYFTAQAQQGRVEAGDLVSFSITDASDKTYLLVGDAMGWIRDRDYRADFEEVSTLAMDQPGQPLDVAFGPLGAAWFTAEFSNAVFQGTAEAGLQATEVPLARILTPQMQTARITRPFGFWLSADKAATTRLSSLSERVLRVGNHIWFTQGGGLQAPGGALVRNHSRLVSLDLAAVDLPSTFYDDRVCVYNVPADDASGYGNNQVLGLAAANGRIWFAESRGLLNDGQSFVSSFIPDPSLCGNLLDFEEAGALAGQQLQYCGDGRTPEQDGCIQRLAMPQTPEEIKVAHLATDPLDDSIWFSDARGRFVGHIDTRLNRILRVYPFPDIHSDPFNGKPHFGGFPWAIRVDHEAVYVSEYATSHVLRFDKETGTFDEIQIPVSNSQVTLHSIDIDPRRGRLWFTLANERRSPRDTAASMIGYISLEAWSDYLAGRRSDVAGVVYTGLGATHEDEGTPQHRSFRGIAVDPASGRVAVADMWRQELLLLRPLPHFWP